MRKVMIVDDEKWIRRGLVQSIDWDRFGLELAGEAGDGKKAYDMALELKPDLLFMDMRMPGYDGKQLLGMMERDLPHALTIVVSGYSDFEYTKEAIRHKAFDYLLKPVKKDELAVLLEKAVAELDRREAERRNASRGGDDWLSRHLQRDSDEPASVDDEPFLPDDWKEGEFAVMVGRPDTYRDPPDIASVLPFLRELLDRNRPFLFGGRWSFEVTQSPGDSRETIVALCGPRLEQGELLQLHKAVQTAWRQAAAGDAGNGFGAGSGPISHGSFSFGVSRRKGQPHKLAEAYREARSALRRKQLGTAGTVLFAGDEVVSVPCEAYPQERENALLLTIQTGNRGAALQEFERWLAAFCSDTATVEQLQHNAIVLIHAIDKQLLAKGANLGDVFGRMTSAYADMILHRSDIVSISKLFEEELLPPMLAYYSRSSEKQSEVIVSELKKLAETQYHQQLSLPQIAGCHYMNPDYVSRLFKKATGKNFVDYLTDVRIGKAKELLRMSAYKNYEIAQMVGYEDYRYFSQIFKKKIGMTIGEYRSRLGTAGK